MFDQILIHLEQQTLLFFWDTKFNMFASLSSAQINDIYLKLKGLRKRLTDGIASGNVHETLSQIMCKKIVHSNLQNKFVYLINICCIFSNTVRGGLVGAQQGPDDYLVQESPNTGTNEEPKPYCTIL